MSLRPITDEEIPFDIPKSWEWVRLGDIAYYNLGKTPDRHVSSFWGDGVPWVSIGDMKADGITNTTKENVTIKAINDCFANKISPRGTLLMSFKLTIGRVTILDMDAVHNEAIVSIYPFLKGRAKDILKLYLYKILPLISSFGDSKNAIKGKTLNSKSLSNLLLPLPPLAEQKRIVEKIGELFKIIDMLDKFH